ncbi:unnamed protein product [Peniophora sp. CBMAI 1063]|nr:unnamed protein product [Peniophora sp. CBMAI 1063]
MAPRASGSRSQRNASQAERRSSRRTEVVEEDEEEEVDMDVGEDEPEVDGDLQKRIAALVRLAIFNEQRRIPLKREEISKKVMGTQRGGFKDVFDGAQERLRTIFGMELVELQTRAATQDTALGGGDAGKRKRGADGPSQSQPNGTQASQSQTQDGVGGAKKRGAAASGAKAYILRSTLEGGLIELAAHTDAAVLEAEMADAPDVTDEGEVGARSYGSILAWNTGDHLAALGVMHVVLALILVNGKVVSDGDLRNTLRRLRLREGDVVDFPATAPHRTTPVDSFLSDLVRRQYLDRSRVGGAPGKRGRGAASQAQNDNEGDAYEWRWGPRAFAEVGELGIARFVAELMAERRAAPGVESSDDDEGDTRARRARKKQREDDSEKKLQAMMRGIERAAGGELTDVLSA